MLRSSEELMLGGHHKVPMADLRKGLEGLGFQNVVTLLNSGNIIFDTIGKNEESLEKQLAEHLEKTFGFPVPTIIRNSEEINQLYNDTPFRDITIHKDIRLYVSFLKNDSDFELKLPWANPDKSFTILDKRGKIILTVVDISIAQTPVAMGVLEKNYGEDITTRSWNTVERIANKL